MKFFNARVWIIIFGVMGLLGGTLNAIAAESIAQDAWGGLDGQALDVAIAVEVAWGSILAVWAASVIVIALSLQHPRGRARFGAITVVAVFLSQIVAVGALSLTPGVRVRDVLQRGVSLRCWDRRSGAHHWHPLFVAGQTWPSEKPFTLVLAASEDNQAFLELVLGEPDNQVRHDVVFVNGLPTLRENSASSEVSRLERADVRLPLTPPGLSGQDCLRLQFRLDEDAQLTVEVEDLRTGDELPRKFLGRIR